MKIEDKQVYDCCVCCGTETKYTVDTPIDQRFGYVEGAGQLCRSCYCDVYANENEEDAV